jgi:hypothetical protein
MGFTLPDETELSNAVNSLRDFSNKNIKLKNNFQGDLTIVLLMLLLAENKSSTSKELASGGTLVTSDTNPVTGINAYQIQVLEDAEFSSLTASDITGATGVYLPTGTILVSFDGITDYTLSSGKVATYLT